MAKQWKVTEEIGSRYISLGLLKGIPTRGEQWMCYWPNRGRRLCYAKKISRTVALTAG